MKQQTQTNKIEWKEFELGELGEIVTGNTPPRNNAKNYGDKTPWIKPPNLDKEKYVADSDEYLSESGAKIARLLPPGSVLVSCIGNLGKIGIAGRELCTNQQINSIVPKKEISSEYLYYAIKKFQKRLEQLASSAVVPLLNKSAFSRIKIPLPFFNNKPDLKEQERIVSILEKAEKQKERGKKAEALLDEYLKSVFNEMFYNKGFDTKKGKELFELTYGKGLPEKERDDGKYAVFGSNGVVGRHSKFLVEGPGIIIGRKGSIGEVNYSKENFWAIDTTYYITLLQKMNLIYLYYLLKSHNLKLNNSTAIPGLNRNDVYRISFIDVPLPLQQKFAKIVEQTEKMKENVRKTKQNSEELFNSLMQKAFKGELQNENKK
jgi:type I restriction enzyme S subunit